jgi:hypothetical protein
LVLVLILHLVLHQSLLRLALDDLLGAASLLVLVHSYVSREDLDVVVVINHLYGPIVLARAEVVAPVVLIGLISVILHLV